MRLIIGWLYPELMSTYGDRGNMICLKKRCEWRGIAVKVVKLELGDWEFKERRYYDITRLRQGYGGRAILRYWGIDLLFMGGGEDWQQKIVGENLRGEKGKKSKMLREMIERGIPGLFICGAYQFLGKYYKTADGTKIPGLGIMNHYTVHPGEEEKRLIGNIVVELANSLQHAPPLARGGATAYGQKKLLAVSRKPLATLVGFENHGGRTYLGKGVEPLGKVIKGFGNNGEDKSEGAVYKNAVGTYLHGPVLPKNPHLADWLIKKALERKYKNKIKLEKLDDELEWQAQEAALSKTL